MRFTILLSSILFLALPLSGCGGHCEYEDIPGKARIVSVDPAPMTGANCKMERVKVVFDFFPDDPSEDDLVEKGWVLTTGVPELNPPRSWVESSGLTVGSEHPAIRSEITQGSCPPTRDIYLTGLGPAPEEEGCF
jgi:hypothetical protein